MFAAGPAHAALTASERSELRARWERADLASAPVVRALVARPDLDAADTGAALADAARGVRFDERHLAFVRALLFGPATQASRTEIVPPVVEALLARAGDLASGEGRAADRAEELVRIHRFVTLEIAGGADPKRDTGIRADARRAALATYRARAAVPSAMRASLDPAIAAAQTQADLAMIALGAGLVAPGDLAGAIGLDGPAREVLERTGVLCAGLDRASAARAAEAVRLIESMPIAARGTSLLWIGKGWPHRVMAAGATIVSQAPLGSLARVPAAKRWPAAVAPSRPDAALSELAFALGRAGAVRLARLVPAFDAAAIRVADRVRKGGDPATLALAPLAGSLGPSGGADGPAFSSAELIGRAVELVAMDAPRALDLALARAALGEREPMATFALALAVIAAGDDGALRPSAEVGYTAPDGARTPLAVTGIAGKPARVERFTLDGHDLAIEWHPDGAIATVTRDGRPPTLSTLATARVPTAAADEWAPPPALAAKLPGLRLTRLAGRPEVGFDDAGRVVVRSSPAGKGRDAVAVAAPQHDFSATLRLRCVGAPCAVVVRAAAGAGDIAGAALTIEPDREAIATLSALDGNGNALPLGDPVALAAPAPEGHDVRVTVRGAVLEITVGDQRLAAKLPAQHAGGPATIAFAPGEGGEAEVRGLAVARAAPVKRSADVKKARR